MQLVRARLKGVGPFDDVDFPFCDEDGRPRPFTLIQGGGGVGKTTLLGAIASTRPGHAVVQHIVSASGEPGDEHGTGSEARAPHTTCDWVLGQDDPDRPHPLCVATPNARVFADDERELLRRREQTLFDRVSRGGGFAFLAIPSSRWFSRQPISFNAPARSIARYDVRGPAGFDDTSLSDHARETKQALAYAAIAAALSRDDGPARRSLLALGDAMRTAVDNLVCLSGFQYRGLDSISFEPMFSAVTSTRRIPFDALPTRVRHLVSFAALPVRTVWAAYPERDPRTAEAVVVIDDVELHLDPTILGALAAALREALPAVQWIVTTASPSVAGICDARDVLALRRLPERDRVELFLGDQARTH